MKWLVVSFLVFQSSVTGLNAQSINEQFWAEYFINYPFANSFNFESAFTYSALLNNATWRSLEYSGTAQWSLNQTIEVNGQLVLSYTNQTESYNTFEVRPVIATRLFFTPNDRIQTRLYLRLEQRNFQDLDTREWTQVYRPRVRAEAIIPISQDSYYKDNLWYALADVEWLFTTDDVQERFANRFRLRIGVGYRLNYSLRFEFVYMNQQSKSGIDETFSSSDNVFRIRLKHYLRKVKPSTATGTGN